MYMLYALIGGGGQMSNTFFESGGKSVADPEGVQGVRSNPPPPPPPPLN